MSASPIIPDSAPFTPEQRAWLNGFIAGLLGKDSSEATAATTTSGDPLLVLFGSQSGNAESLANRIGKEAAGAGFSVRVVSLDAIAPAQLEREKNLLLITSTWGEGDMPDNAAAFWDGLNQNGASPKLTGLRYSVLALGDRNYSDTFCLAGQKFDRRLAELGAEAIHSRVECDVEFDEPAKQWTTGVLAALKGNTKVVLDSAATTYPEQAVGHSRKNPYPARLLVNQRLTGEGSAKEIRHFSFLLKGSGLSYEAGDALGVFPANCPSVVDAVIEMYRLDADEVVPLPDGAEVPLREALLRHFEIRSLLQTNPDKEQSAIDFISGLKRLQPRLYSIASSPKAHDGEVHLCVGIVRYIADGIHHKGVASTYLAERLALTETAPVFVHAAKHFRPPLDLNAPMIMVGPGTGIAPFRAFLEERRETGAQGNNWLFFGDQRSATDFIYREEIEAMAWDGHLTRLDTAFSRDQGHKIYVQHRMKEKADALWRWLDAGAHFYVCGDATRMARDVDAALHEIIKNSGGKSCDAATEYIAEMKRTKRYARDVY